MVAAGFNPGDISWRQQSCADGTVSRMTGLYGEAEKLGRTEDDRLDTSAEAGNKGEKRKSGLPDANEETWTPKNSVKMCLYFSA